nr:prepilin-type N-terminal cleavage/methylation domain-containing protein [Phycisphaerales bacterium]
MHRPHPLLNGSRAGGTWRARARSAFSLIELLVVMFIIVLVISIVVPALAKARQATRVTATKNLMSNLLTSAATFQQDERRLPGRYSGRDMGSDNNANTIGMTMTENILLDLAGGVVQIGGPRPSTGGVHVHPFGGTSSSRASQEGAWVDVGLIGQPSKSGKGYFIPDKKFFIEQVNPSQVGTAGTPDADGRTYPDLVDAFGQPLLVWVEDESTVGRVAFDSSSSGPNNFARVKSD